MPRISGTSSSAATKCISDVPGFVKHTSTPESTSVRISACAPFTDEPPSVSGRAATAPSDGSRRTDPVCPGRCGGLEDRAGVEDPLRVERGLDPPHQLDLGGVLELE